MVRDELLVNFERRLDYLCRVTNRVVEWVVGFAVLAIAVVFLWEIGVRFFRIGSLRWALETNRFMFIVIGFLGSTVAYRRGRHVRFEYFERKVASRGVKRALAMLAHVSVLLLGLILLKEGYASVLNQLTSFLPATGLSRAWLFAPIPLSGLLLGTYAAQQVTKLWLDLSPARSSSGDNLNG